MERAIDPEIDPAYVTLLTDQPLNFEFKGIPLKTSDLAKFLTAQSGVEMLDCLKCNLFSSLDVPPKWDFGTVPPISMTMEHISGTFARNYLQHFADSRSRSRKDQSPPWSGGICTSERRAAHGVAARRWAA